MLKLLHQRDPNRIKFVFQGAVSGCLRANREAPSQLVYSSVLFQNGCSCSCHLISVLANGKKEMTIKASFIYLKNLICIGMHNFPTHSTSSHMST